MSQDIYVETRHIGYAILWGLKLALVYDAFLIFRNVIRHKNVIVYIEDFVYWIFCAFFVFDSLYEIGDGYIRWYMALGVGIGMLIYKLTLSKWLVKIGSVILGTIKIFVLRILFFILKPFLKMGRGIKRIFCYMKNRVKKKLTRTIKMLKITLCKR